MKWIFLAIGVMLICAGILAEPASPFMIIVGILNLAAFALRNGLDQDLYSD